MELVYTEFVGLAQGTVLQLQFLEVALVQTLIHGHQRLQVVTEEVLQEVFLGGDDLLSDLDLTAVVEHMIRHGGFIRVSVTHEGVEEGGVWLTPDWLLGCRLAPASNLLVAVLTLVVHMVVLSSIGFVKEVAPVLKVELIVDVVTHVFICDLQFENFGGVYAFSV